MSYQKSQDGDFPGSPAAEILCAEWGAGFDSRPGDGGPTHCPFIKIMISFIPLSYLQKLILKSLSSNIQLESSLFTEMD